MNIHKSGLYKVACRFPMFPCRYVIHWIVSHTDLETMILRSASGARLAPFRIEDYQEICHFPFLVNKMNALFYTPNDSTDIRDILKRCVKELTNFRMAPNQIYRMKTLK